MKNKIIKALLLTFSILLIIGVILYLFPFIINLSTHEGQLAFKNEIDNLGVWGIIVLFMLQLLQIVLVVLPGEPLEILAGMCYGPIGGTIFIIVSVFITTTLIYLLVGKFGKKYLYNTFSKEKIQKITYSLYIKLLDFYIKRINKISYELHDGVVLLSDSYVNIYKKMIDKNAQNIYAIPNPIPNISSKVSIECKKNRIIFVGHLTKVKAVDRLLSIWYKIQVKNKEWSLLIIGDGPERAYLESIAKNNNLERVPFMGRVKSIDYIDSAKILCLVSNFEGLPTVFLEAMRLGVVPVGYDTFPAIYDIIDNKKSGFIIPVEDEDY